MKKVLFATTALLAAGLMQQEAKASEPIKLGLGGFMYWYVAAADQDDDSGLDTNSFDVIGSAEVYFNGQTTLDNGMNIGVQVELEAGTRSGNDDIDESYMWLSGKYGKLIVGSENDVAYKMAVQAPSVSVHGAVGYDDGISWELLPLNQVTRSQTLAWFTGDANKLSYFTPRYYGLQAGVSYVPSNATKGDDDGASVTRVSGSFDDAWAFALNYTDTFDNGVGVAASTTYSWYDDNSTTDDDDAETTDLQFGLNVSYKGFTLGGAALLTSADTNSNYAAYEGLNWHVGAQYKEGPYGVSFTYFASDVEGSSTTSKEDETDLYQLSGTYQLGKGVKAFGDLIYQDAEDESGDADQGNEGAYGATIGMKLTF